MNSESKNKILKRIRQGLQNEAANEIIDPQSAQRLHEKVETARPLTKAERINRFKTELELVNGTCHGPYSKTVLIEALTGFFRENEIEKLATGSELQTLKISEQLKKELSIETVIAAHHPWPSRKEKLAHIPASFLSAQFGVADLGQLIFLYDTTQTSLPHFLCDHSIVMLPANNIVADQFELFGKLSAADARNMV